MGSGERGERISLGTKNSSKSGLLLFPSYLQGVGRRGGFPRAQSD